MAIDGGGLEGINEMLIGVEQARQDLLLRKDALSQELGGLIGHQVTIRGFPDTVIFHVGTDKATGRECFEVAEMKYPLTPEGEYKPSLLIDCDVLAANSSFIEVSAVPARLDPRPIQVVSYLFRIQHILELSHTNFGAIAQAS
jgi:hypothetical protein